MCVCEHICSSRAKFNQERFKERPHLAALHSTAAETLSLPVQTQEHKQRSRRRKRMAKFPPKQRLCVFVLACTRKDSAGFLFCRARGPAAPFIASGFKKQLPLSDAVEEAIDHLPPGWKDPALYSRP